MSELNSEVFKKELSKGFEEQARLINNAFQDQKDYIDQQTNKINGRIDLLQDELKTDIHRVEAKVDKAIYSEFSHFEARLKRVEQKLGINPAA